MDRKEHMLRRLGWLGLISLLSYTLAVIFAPLAYPGYNSLAQAVSDLSADTAPSRTLWHQLAALYGPCALVCLTAGSIAVSVSERKTLRLGVTLFTVMQWVTDAGYTMFPLTGAGSPTGIQNIMHIVVTAVVVLLSVVSLPLIYIGTRGTRVRSLGLWAVTALGFMLLGAIGVNAVPAEYFGIPERFSVFAATGFTAVIGVYLATGQLEDI